MIKGTAFLSTAPCNPPSSPNSIALVAFPASYDLYLAVCSDLGVLIACSMVLGRPPIVPGRKNPDTGRPDCDSGRMP